MPMPENSITIDEASKQLGLGLRNTYIAAEKGDIPAIRIGGRWVIPKPAWEQFLLGKWKPERSSGGND